MLALLITKILEYIFGNCFVKEIGILLQYSFLEKSEKIVKIEKCFHQRHLAIFLCKYSKQSIFRSGDNTNEFSSGGITHFFEGGTTNSCCFSKSGTTNSKIVTKWNNKFMDVQWENNEFNPLCPL